MPTERFTSEQLEEWGQVAVSMGYTEMIEALAEIAASWAERDALARLAAEAQTPDAQ
jgi:hypothetical protein